MGAITSAVIAVVGVLLGWITIEIACKPCLQQARQAISAVIAVVGVLLGWITIEIACKPCLEKGREAIDRSLDPDYDPDDTAIRAPLNPTAASATVKAV
ncbi:hypothetical protein glysoja_032815 [Glycine soja]|uniref:Outer envelope membrane protein 7 n=1 Tax=Glycine soja TaxID=3848 RepID=A0A0B2PHE1_GLYSO|nr:hypothetical protein glysoja_032815 [Glycine soja]